MLYTNKVHNLKLTKQEEDELSHLFKRIDRNNDGKIDVTDLAAAFTEMKVPQMPGQAQQFFDKYDHDNDGHIDFYDFAEYMTEHQKALKISFHELDHNNDGLIDKDEIIVAFKKMGLQIDKSEALRLLKMLDKDQTLLINWEEWKSYFMLHPVSSLHDIVHHWRHATIIDIGENALVPDDFTETELTTGMWWRHLLAGGVAGVVSRTCTAPLDRLKIILLVNAAPHRNLKIISGFRHMLAEGGVKSLWRGNGINVIKIAPENAIKFMAYEQIKRLIRVEKNEKLGIVERFAAGSLAGAIAQTATFPMDVIKVRLAIRTTGQYTGIAHCARSVYASGGGLRNFYRGYLPNIIGIMPYAGIDLAVYETLKSLYIERHAPGQDPGVAVLLACGTFSSSCGQLASYPLSLVRTKLQAKVAGSADTMLGQFRSIIETDGPKGLYRGITPNFMKVAPAVSISYVVYEHMRKVLGVQMT